MVLLNDHCKWWLIFSGTTDMRMIWQYLLISASKTFHKNNSTLQSYRHVVFQFRNFKLLRIVKIWNTISWVCNSHTHLDVSTYIALEILSEGSNYYNHYKWVQISWSYSVLSANEHTLHYSHTKEKQLRSRLNKKPSTNIPNRNR